VLRSGSGCCIAVYILLCRRDWGFLIFGSDLGDAIACFNEQLKETLVISTEADDKVPGSEEQGSDAAAAEAGAKTIHGFLSRAVKNLQAKVGLGRAQSLPDEAACHAAADAAAAAKGPLDKVAAHAAMSEPSSPMIGTDLPDSIRCLSQAPHRNSSEAYRVPSFQTGFKPW
jgi:NAD(P)-dependent dehydrogenase (short-subunit alcohol dehydrogenase family)